MRADHFRTVIIVGAIPHDAVPDRSESLISVKETSVQPEDGPVDVKNLIRLVSRLGVSHGPCLVLTLRELKSNDITVFGYAHEASRIALVSLNRIGHAASWEISKRRICNEAMHELGHLNGLAHCSHRCVMKPVTTAKELDCRPFKECGHCPRRFGLSVIRKAAASGLLLGCVALANTLLSQFFPPAGIPFSCWATDSRGQPSRDGAGLDDRVSIYFRSRELLTLRDKGGHRSIRERSVPVVEALNKVAHSHDKRVVSVIRKGPDEYAVGFEGSAPLLDVLPGDKSASENAQRVAERWAQSLNASMGDCGQQMR